MVAREVLQRLEPVEDLVRDVAGLPLEPAAGRGRLAAAVLAGEEPVREREVGHEADPEPAADGKQLLLRASLEQVVVVLEGDEAGASCRRADLLRLLEQ